MSAFACRPAKKHGIATRNDIAPACRGVRDGYSITRSARSRMDCESATPIPLAVMSFHTNSKRVGGLCFLEDFAQGLAAVHSINSGCHNRVHDAFTFSSVTPAC